MCYFTRNLEFASNILSMIVDTNMLNPNTANILNDFSESFIHPKPLKQTSSITKKRLDSSPFV